MWIEIGILGLFTLLGNFVQAQELRCQNGNVSWVEFGETHEERRSLCFNADKTILTSPKCAQKECSVFQMEKKYKLSELSSELGKPGAHLCRLLKGRVQIVNFHVEEATFKLDRCLLQDGEFVDTGYLLILLLEKEG